MKKKILIPLSLGGLLSIIALYLAFRNVPFPDLVHYLGTINYFWILPTTIITILTFVLRTIRWKLILRSAQSVPFWPAFHPLMIGFMMNCLLPGRVGELARPILLKKERRIPLATGLATVVAERLFDIVLLIILFSMVSSTIRQAPNLQISFASYTLDSQTLSKVAGGLMRLNIALLLILISFTIAKVRYFISRVVLAIAALPIFSHPRFQPIIQKIAYSVVGIINNFSEGLRLVANPLSLFGCLIFTILIWTLTVLSYYTISFGFPGLELGLWEWTTFMVIVCLFIALPSVPGFWGLWEAGGVFALSLFGISSQQAAGFTLVSHVVQMFPVILIGLLSALLTSVNIFKVRYNENVLEPIT